MVPIGSNFVLLVFHVLAYIQILPYIKDDILVKSHDLKAL